MYKKALIWSIVTNTWHTSIPNTEKTIEALMPLVEALFPGINYYSISGFNSVMNKCVRPALIKLYGNFGKLSAKDVSETELVEISKPVMPSKGYEWEDDPQWKIGFEQFIAA
jgi:hypothetical protein